MILKRNLHYVPVKCHASLEALFSENVKANYEDVNGL